jgi:hypothetical protein
MKWDFSRGKRDVMPSIPPIFIPYSAVNPPVDTSIPPIAFASKTDRRVWNERRWKGWLWDLVAVEKDERLVFVAATDVKRRREVAASRSRQMGHDPERVVAHVWGLIDPLPSEEIRGGGILCEQGCTARRDLDAGREAVFHRTRTRRFERRAHDQQASPWPCPEFERVAGKDLPQDFYRGARLRLLRDDHLGPDKLAAVNDVEPTDPLEFEDHLHEGAAQVRTARGRGCGGSRCRKTDHGEDAGRNESSQRRLRTTS